MDTIGIELRLRGYVREEGGEWLAGCPSLDVHTQADSKEGAVSALREAVGLWLESCLERETLPAAMRELGWYRLDRPSAAGDVLSVAVTDDVAEGVLGEPFPIELSVPAFLVASDAGRDRAAG